MNERKVGAINFAEFNSLAEFYEYIMNTPINDTFKYNSLSSVQNDYWFTKTHSFEEAVKLLKNGWQDMSEKLNQTLKVEVGKMEKVMVSKSVLGVQGYHSVVPLYLNGVPTNMISRKMQPVKQKVVTLNKSVCYRGSVSIDRIVEESIKALSIVKKLENQNYRCNLNVILGTKTRDCGYVIKVRIKTANERLNVNKLSFPLVHPSMLRRLFFRFIEVYPGVPYSFTGGYGRPIDSKYLREAYPNEILLPHFIYQDIRNINTLDDLDKIF